MAGLTRATRIAAAAVLAFALPGAPVSRSGSASASPAAQADGNRAPQQDGDLLPDGEGRKILDAACTSCHDLTEVTKFRGYYTRDQWRDVVVTMVEYGADLQPREIDVLADYLTEHLGKKTGP